jgi:hypothetical protein
MARSAKCPTCGVPAVWDYHTVIVDTFHDAAGYRCRCCNGFRAMTLYYVPEHRPMEIAKEWPRGKFVGRDFDKLLPTTTTTED